MKTKQSLWKKKLVKTTYLMTAILVAALFLGTAVSAGIARSNAETINTITVDNQAATKVQAQNPFTAAIGTPVTPSVKNERLQQSTTPLNPLENIIRFHDGTMYTGVGLTSGGTFEEAIRITPTEQGSYTGYGLIAVSFYHYGAATHSGNIKIYAAGTASAPGALLLSVPYTVTGDGMKRIDLTSSVSLPITADLWVSVETTHAAGEYPAGADNGPAIIGKGDWIYYSGAWSEIQPGLNYNWMIDAIIDMTTQYEHDVGVQEIVKPASGVGTAFTPEVRVKNFGLTNETNVPVNLKITKYEYTTLLNQDFAPMGTFPPTGWTRTNTKWQQVNSAVAGGTAPEAEFYYSPSETGDFRLYTNAINTTGYTALNLQFRTMVNHYAAPYTLKVETSTDAVTWNTAWSINPTASIPAHIETVPLTTGVGSSTFYISWTFSGNSFNINYWYLDDCKIQLVNPIVEYNQTVLININSGVVQNVVLPGWTPADLGVSENVNVDYKVEAKTQLVGDNYTANDYKTNMITLNFGYFHDIAVTSIPAPVSGNAGVITPIVQVKNVGQNDETAVPINLVISKPYFAEHFTSTVFPPAGWTQEQTGEWARVTTALAGGVSPEARLYYSYIVGNYAYLQSPAVDTSGTTSLKLEFRSFIDTNYGGANQKVLIRSSALANWTDITPWANPVNVDIPKAKYIIDISAYVGNGTQVQFEFSGTSAGLYYWYLDDVVIYQLDTTEFDETINVDIDSGEILNVTFPDWTPSDLGISENADIEYAVVAESQLGTDGNAANDILGKAIILHYPYFDDVAVTQIIEPQNGLAQVQPVKVAISNNGQNDESVFVDVVIEKFNATSEGFEGSDGGYVQGGTPAGTWAWGTPTSGPGSAHTGSKLWATVLGGTYPTNANVTLDKAVTLPSGSISLIFWHWYDTEASYDGGNVKISTDNGTTWTLLIPDGGYTGVANSANPLGLGNPIWTGHVQAYWEKETFNLNAYAGLSVIVRWHFGSDSSVVYPGWYIDDVTFADPSAFIPEYDETVSVDIASGDAMNVTFPDWTPSDITLAFGIDYRATATATIAGWADVVTEDFSNPYVPAYYSIPTEWTNIPSNPTSTWFIETTNTRARCQETGKLGLAQNELLKSPPFNSAGMAVVKIQYTAYMYRSTTVGDSQVEVLGSLDGGATWPQLIKTYNTPGGTTYPAEEYDISAWAANQPSVTIGYRFSSPADINTTDYFYFDNFWIGNEVPIITETFNSYTPGYYILPTGWTTQVTNPTGKWWMYYSGTTAYYPKVNESGSDGLAQDEWLFSPVIDCLALTQVKLQYTKAFYNYSGSNSMGQVLGSIDGGLTWTKYIVNYTVTSTTAEDIDVSSWAAGQANVKIAFRFISGADTTKTDYWYIDNFFLGTLWGPMGDIPPAGWTILDYGSIPGTWNNNDWHRYAAFGGYVARVYYSPVEQQDEWLITPTIDCTALAQVTLSFNHYFYWGAALDYGAVQGSTDNGATWTQPIANFTATDGTSTTGIVRTYDISAWAATQSQVKIRFRYSANNDWYWYVDDVKILSGTTTIYSQNFEGIGYGTGFDSGWVSASWGPLGWQVSPIGIEGDKRWNVQNTANAGGTAPEARFYYYPAMTGDYSLYSGALDTTGYTALTLSFKEKTTHSATPYFLNVSVSTDGITWTTVLSRSPTASYGPVTTAIPLTTADGIGSATFRVRFTVSVVGTASKITYWYIDNVKLGTLVTIYQTSFDTNYVPESFGPLGWTRTHTNWALYNSANAGGAAPELRFYYSPSFTGVSRMYTGPIDTSAYTDLTLQFKHFLDHYATPYTLLVETSIDGVNWNTAWSIAPTANVGPETVNIPLTAADGVGSSTFRISFTFSGYTFNIDYWYIDDVKLRNVAITPDGNPGNNVLAKWFTLSYEHDVGISMITEPLGPHSTQTKTWTTGDTTNAMSDGGYLFEAAIRFNVTDMSAYNDWDINTVQFFKGYGTTAVPACSGNIKVYSSTDPIQPETLITTQPWSAGVGSMWVDVILSSPVKIQPGLDYWVSVEYTAGYTSFPAGCDIGPAVDFKGDWLWDEVTPWTEMQIWGFNYNWNIKAVLISPVPAEWPPGTYPIAAIADNYGVTFTENNFVVNAKVFKTSKADVLVYEENVTVTGALAPGQNVLKNFPDITIDNVTASEGNYRIEIKTMLPGDDHPTNDKKTKTFKIVMQDFLPPVTTHAFAGTMGNNGWYRSDVTITLTASDPTPPYSAGKGPSGVNHTYYKIDSGAFVEYTAPVVINTDGQYQVSYYSVDMVGNTETVNGPFSFKMDKTDPVWINYTGTPLNLLKTKWLLVANVEDATSGIAVVEFYVDDALVGNDTTAPYEFEYTGTTATNNSQALAYDEAGNSAMSPLFHNYEFGNQQQSYPSMQTLKLKNI
ncbi:MAG: choice-of-anchor J domain-containing protein [Thermoplasmata archaeon]|nr:choice-of-anchor J domain-containing protein [Thermoplasmata archaeon]